MEHEHHCHHYDAVYEEAEIKANKFNLLFLACIAVVDIIVVILSIVRVFSAPLEYTLPAAIVSLVLYITPILIYLVHDKLLKKKESVTTKPYFKYIILFPSYFALNLMIIMMSFHTVLLLVIPTLMAAQYRFNRKGWVVILVSSVLAVPIVVYCSCLFGIADRNLLKGLAEEDLNSIQARFDYLMGKRAGEIFLHHILPRALALISVDILIAVLIQRHNSMLDKQAELAHEVAEEAEKRDKLQSAVIDELATVIETRDVGTGEHVKRTKKYVNILCIELAKSEKYHDILTDEAIKRITAAAALHDIGKIAVSDTILLKPGRLTPEEFDKMKIHTTKGGEMVKKFFEVFTEENFFEDAYAIAMYHHEKWDGTGYPEGRKQEDIPLCARIMAIADVFDALVSKRVYKDAFPVEEAFDIIVQEGGSHFDPELIEVLKSVKNEFIEASK